MEYNTIIQGDCLEVMKDIPDKSVDLIIIDPPYGSSGRDGSVHLEKDNLLGNRMCSDALVWLVRQYSKEFFRVTKSDSHCYVFSDWRKYKDIQMAFETNFWELRQLIVWDKKNGMGEFWRSTHEFILFFTKRNPKKLTHGGCFNVLRDKPIRGKAKKHDYEKPVSLIERLIVGSSNEGDLILDCFLGSGSTAIACLKLNRKYLGIEISPEYCKMAEDRIEEELKQGNLF